MQIFHNIDVKNESYISVSQLEKYVHGSHDRTSASMSPCPPVSRESSSTIPKAKPQPPPSTPRARRLQLRQPSFSPAPAPSSSTAAHLRSGEDSKPAQVKARGHLGAFSPYADKLRKDIRNHEGRIYLGTFLLLVFPAAKHALVDALLERLALRHARASDALSAAQLAELREMFERLDQDNSGGIDAEEMVVLASGGRTGVDGDEIRDLFAAFDTGGCGVLDWEVRYTHTHTHTHTPTHTHDGSGMLIGRCALLYLTVSCVNVCACVCMCVRV